MCNASSVADTLTSSIPTTSGHFEPNRRPARPASGPAKSMASELGSRYSPAWVAVAPKPYP